MKSIIKSRFQQKNQFNKKTIKLSLVVTKPLIKVVKAKIKEKFQVIPNNNSCCVNLSSRI